LFFSFFFFKSVFFLALASVTKQAFLAAFAFYYTFTATFRQTMNTCSLITCFMLFFFWQAKILSSVFESYEYNRGVSGKHGGKKKQNFSSFYIDLQNSYINSR